MSPERAVSESCSVELLDQIDITHERDDDIVEGYVSVGLINQEDVAVDHAHVDELAESIRKESTKGRRTGQLTPILLGEVPGEGKFRIIDGFHRSAAIAAIDKRTAYATIKKDATIEDIIDLRIVAAKSHQTISFSRIVEWIEEAWSQTDWSTKISVSSAFDMEQHERAGAHFDLSEEETMTAKTWVVEKSQQWGISVNMIASYLRVAKKADPTLVARVRDRKSGHKLEDITTAHLNEIVRLLPDRYDLQNIVADTAVDNILTVAQTNSLATAVSRAKTREDIDRYIENKVWQAMGSASEAIRQKHDHKIEIDNTSAFDHEVLLTRSLKDQIAIAELTIENAILTGLYVPKLDQASPVLTALTIRLGFDGQSDSTEQSDVEDLAEDSVSTEWNHEKIQGIAERSFALHSFMAGIAIRRYGMDHATAEDLASESTVALLNAVNKDRVPADLDGADLHRLLARIVINRCINELRKVNGVSGNRRTVPLLGDDDGRTAPIDKISVDDDSLEKLNSAVESPNFIKNMLPYLSEKERRATVLKGIFGLKNDEIAAVMSTTKSSVTAMLQRLRKKSLQVSEELRLEAIEL